MPFRKTTFDNHLPDMPGHRRNMEPDPLSTSTSAKTVPQWLMRKHQGIALRRARLPRACPAETEAIVQYNNGVGISSRITASAAAMVFCFFVVNGLPVQHSEVNSVTSGCTVFPLQGSVRQGLKPACIKSCPTGADIRHQGTT